MKGDGSLFQRSGVWYASYNANGRRFKRSLKTLDRDEARQRLDRLRGAARAEPAVVRTAVQALVAGELAGSDLLLLRGPVVYAWFRGDAALYVGKGQMGMARPLGQRHHRLREILPTDRIKVWFCESNGQAQRRERELIRTLKPSLNVKRR